MSYDEATAALTAPGERLEIGEEVIRGIPTKVWKSAPASLREILELSRGHGDAPFLVYEDERWTFERHYRAAAALAHALVDRFGVQPGDRVAIAMRNFPEWAVSFWAAAAAGAVVVPLNAWWTAEELEYGLADSGSVVLFCDEERAGRMAPHVAGLGLRNVVVAKAEGALPGGMLRVEDVIDGQPEPAGEALPAVEIAPEDDATIFYTSGTTGRPKGAVGTHRNILTNLVSLGFVSACNAVRFGADESRDHKKRQPASLLSVPLFHATGCHSILLSSTAAGAKLVMMYKWDPERALELIEREEITSFGGVPAMVMQVLESPDLAKRDTSSISSVGYGGAPAPPELVRRIRDAFGDVISPSNGYGLTETSSVSTMNRGPDYVRKPDSVGRPVPVVSVKVVDDAGREVAEGGVGELWIRGPNVVRGYWNKPEATAEGFTDGWLHTGDIARVDDEGFVYIVDRAKDMVIRGGENVYCVEVETVLYDHPAVVDAAVFGIPHPVLGEEVAAVVQVKRGASVTEQELRDHVAAHLAGFKVPVRVEVRDEPLPRNPQGKILKRQLRDEVT